MVVNVQVLAHDDMNGREAGRNGHRKAAAYVASQFRRAGLVALSDARYLQPVPMRGVRFNEPVRWPFFSSTVMSLRERPLTPAAPGAPMGLQFNPADAEELFHGSGHTYAELRSMADRGERLPTFLLAVRLRAHLDIQPLEITSENVVAVLQGRILSSPTSTLSSPLTWTPMALASR